MVLPHKLLNKVLLGISVLSVVALGMPAAKAAAINPQPARCANNAPASWQWTHEVTYYTNDRWCLHDAGTDTWLVWQNDGNFVWYAGNRMLLASNTGNIGAMLVEQTDGNIVVKDATGRTRFGLNYWSHAWRAATPANRDTSSIQLAKLYVTNAGYMSDINYYTVKSGKITYSATLVYKK